MWSRTLDMTMDECRTMLRKLELEAYANVVNTFRAQGLLDEAKLKVLGDLRDIMHISQDRHRCEMRRATNDEHLSTIADRIYGNDSVIQWTREGKRGAPLLCRSKPYTAFTLVSSNASSCIATLNKQLPLPHQVKRTAASVISSPLLPPKTNVMVVDPLRGGKRRLDETDNVTERTSVTASGKQMKQLANSNNKNAAGTMGSSPKIRKMSAKRASTAAIPGVFAVGVVGTSSPSAGVGTANKGASLPVPSTTTTTITGKSTITTTMPIAQATAIKIQSDGSRSTSGPRNKSQIVMNLVGTVNRPVKPINSTSRRKQPPPPPPPPQHQQQQQHELSELTAGRPPPPSPLPQQNPVEATTVSSSSNSSSSSSSGSSGRMPVAKPSSISISNNSKINLLPQVANSKRDVTSNLTKLSSTMGGVVTASSTGAVLLANSPVTYPPAGSTAGLRATSSDKNTIRYHPQSKLGLLTAKHQQQHHHHRQILNTNLLSFRPIKPKVQIISQTILKPGTIIRTPLLKQQQAATIPLVKATTTNVVQNGDNSVSVTRSNNVGNLSSDNGGLPVFISSPSSASESASVAASMDDSGLTVNGNNSNKATSMNGKQLEEEQSGHRQQVVELMEMVEGDEDADEEEFVLDDEDDDDDDDSNEIMVLEQQQEVVEEEEEEEEEEAEDAVKKGLLNESIIVEERSDGDTDDNEEIIFELHESNEIIEEVGDEYQEVYVEDYPANGSDGELLQVVEKGTDFEFLLDHPSSSSPPPQVVNEVLVREIDANGHQQLRKARLSELFGTTTSSTTSSSVATTSGASSGGSSQGRVDSVENSSFWDLGTSSPITTISLG